MLEIMLNIGRRHGRDRAMAEIERARLAEEIRGDMVVLSGAAERARLRRLLRQSISLTHVHVLTVLRTAGAIPVGELARALDVSVASATGIISRMEQRGLVSKSRSRDDRRVVSVTIAAGGQAALEQLEAPSRERFLLLLGGLTLGELRTVRAAFGALRTVHESRAVAGGACVVARSGEGRSGG